MIIGRMNKRISLQEAVKTADGAGGFKVVWTDRGTVWAEFKTPPALSVKGVEGAVASVAVREVKIRRRQDVAPGWRVLYGSAVWEVEHAYELDLTETVLVCKDVRK